MPNNGKRVAWVTGGASGIGEAGAEALAADGWTVCGFRAAQGCAERHGVQDYRARGQAEAIALDVGRTVAFVSQMLPRVCMNEILISPTWNRGFVQTPANRTSSERANR